MNLIENKYIDYPIFKFREEQYKRYAKIIRQCLSHIDKHSSYFYLREGFSDKDIVSTQIEHQYEYIKSNKLLHITSKLFDENISLAFLMPMLVSRQYFFISSMYYLPVLQISNKPISFNESAVVFRSTLFEFVCYNFKGKGIVKFMEYNYNLNLFALILFSKDISKVEKLRKCIGLDPKVSVTRQEYDEFSIDFKQHYNLKDDEKLSMSKCYKLISSLFFDDCTKETFTDMYQSIDFKHLFDEYVLDNDDPERVNFINLDNKHLQFIEPIISPILQNIFKVLKNSITGVNIFKIEGGDAVIQNFFSHLKGKFIYKSANGLATLETNATFNIPTKNAPPSITSIDKTFKNRICPVTVSGDNIGETVSLVSDVDINIKTGEFL